MSEKKLGDLTSDALKAARIDRLASVYYKVTKKPCNCEENKQRLNKLHQNMEDIINAKATRKKDS